MEKERGGRERETGIAKANQSVCRPWASADFRVIDYESHLGFSRRIIRIAYTLLGLFRWQPRAGRRKGPADFQIPTSRRSRALAPPPSLSQSL